VNVDLLPAESVLWQGKPARYPWFERSDRYLLLPMWGVFAVIAVWLFIAPPAADTTLGRLFPVSWSAVLVWVMADKLVMRQRTLRSTEYVVTDQRVVVTTRPFGSRLEHSAYLSQLEPPTLAEHGNGLGSIIFGRPSVIGLPRGTRPKPGQTVGLEQIPNAGQVRDTIAAAQAAGR
jgi:hypothetical protein